MKAKLLALLIACACNCSMADQVTTFGAPDCGTWVNAQMPSHRAWLLGFMSGKNNMAADRGFDPLDQLSSGNQILVWMDNWCRANPLKSVVDGSNVLWFELVTQTKRK
jgi:hypothetical protein